MTPDYELMFKEDIEPEELDDIMYRMEREHEIMEKFFKNEDQRNKPSKKAKILIGKTLHRYKNRKYVDYGTADIQLSNPLPF